ncbi:S-layer homology domain-containing protein [Paenibacillus sp. HWE-109]|uniref:S-layer homology domain-containing protein n=1 Tax=Paenibacillus sp. HWE-109 TaxID=1306526 RepID=UPI001EE103C0|nr:S-layer homology domain-containing protein [Paenibacillus sp. HWE-109]UKS25089.1 S-layer homology domain-containing protein [Paenibacillus sp. HWE-109]
MATFAPDAQITRQEMAAMVVRAYSVKSSKDIPTTGVKPAGFDDAGSVAPWAASFVQSAIELQLMRGRVDTDFAPMGITTRARRECAGVLNLLNVGKP